MTSSPQRVTETSDYVAMMTRIITAFGDRIAADPVALAHLRDLQNVLTDQVRPRHLRGKQGQVSLQSERDGRHLGHLAAGDRQADRARLDRLRTHLGSTRGRRGGTRRGHPRPPRAAPGRRRRDGPYRVSPRVADRQ
jgi:hypothetical protein